MESSLENLVAHEWDKYRDSQTPLPNILLLGAADSGKEAFAKQAFGRNFTSFWDIGFHTVVPLPEGERLGIRLIDSHGFERLDGNSKSLEDYNKALDTLLDHNRAADGAHRIHAVWYCISASSGKSFQQDMVFLAKLCAEESLRDKIAVVVLQDDAARRSRTIPPVILSLKDAIRLQPRESAIGFSVCNGPDLAPDGEKLIKWTADQIQDEDMKEAFITSQVVSYRAKKKIADACRVSMTPSPSILPLVRPQSDVEKQRDVIALAKAIHVYNMERYISKYDVVELVEWKQKQPGKLIPPGIPVREGNAPLVDAVSEICRVIWDKSRKDKNLDVAAMFNAEAIKRYIEKMAMSSYLLG